MSNFISPENIKEKAKYALHALEKNGAELSDVIISGSSGYNVSIRNGEVENIENSEQIDIGLRAICDTDKKTKQGGRQAFITLSDLTKSSIDKSAQRCVEMAKLAPIDPYCGIVENPSSDYPHIPMANEERPDDLLSKAINCEKKALSHGKITNSYGSQASYGQSFFSLVTSHGFQGHYNSSYHALSVAVIAGENDQMERDYFSDSKNRQQDLRDSEEIGDIAAKRAIERLGSKSIASQKTQIVFDERISSSLLSILVGAIRGGAIARGVSFLKDKKQELIFNKDINIIDDPLIPYGDGSCAFDGEGLLCKKSHIIENGVLNGFICNLANANKLGLQPTGHASRSIGSPPSENISNLTLPKGKVSKDGLLTNLKDGILITETFSPQVNSNNGDYSVGCAGFLFSNGVIQHPVSEITISGNLLEMYKNIIAADDLFISGSINAPSLAVGEMSVSGQND